MAGNKVDQDQLKQILIGGDSSEGLISNISINDIEFPVDKIENKTFSGVEWSHVDASKRSFSNILFKDCSINNVDFSDAIFENVRFKNSSLKNVILNRLKADIIVFENTEIAGRDSDSEESFLNMDVDEFRVIGSSVKKINAYGSRVNFVFRGVEIEDVSGYGLRAESSILIDHSNAVYMVFSNSNLNFLKIMESNIVDSKINDSSIGEISFKNNSFSSFSVSGDKKYNKIDISATSGIAVTGTGPIKNVSIKDCSGKEKNIYLGDMVFDDMKIEDCSSREITYFDSRGKSILLKNVNADILDIENIDIEDMIFENVKIEEKIYMSNARVKNYSAKSVTLGKDISIKDNGANFKIENKK